MYIYVKIFNLSYKSDVLGTSLLLASPGRHDVQCRRQTCRASLGCGGPWQAGSAPRHGSTSPRIPLALSTRSR
jgi:hypothetical protein